MKKDSKQENMTGQTESAGLYRRPIEKQWKCKNHILESINEMKNLSVNGSKDSQYNDFIRFEYMFENWDQQSILLTEWKWYRKDKNPFVYFSPIGIYTSIGLFARKLQRVLDFKAPQISVIMIGEDLHITVYHEKDNFDNTTSYEAKTVHINQINDGFHYDGWKFELPPQKEPKQKSAEKGTNV